MVDVGDKLETDRVAVAEAVVLMRPATLDLVEAGHGQEGGRVRHGPPGRHRRPEADGRLDPAVPPGAGGGQRRGAEPPTPACPGCASAVEVHAFDRTGVEMEAMVGATAAALTVYDMVKGVERGVEIGPVRLLEKRGGRSGVCRAP